MEDVDSAALAADLQNGAYFKASHDWYSEIFHVPIAQRSYYIIVILLSMINVYFAIQSFFGVFPISVPVPFVTYSTNIMEEIPRIKRISPSRMDDKNTAVMQFFLTSYVQNREAYDLLFFELRYRNIWSQSTKNVFEEYKKQIDPSNPYGFYHLYTNRSKRVIDIVSLDYDRERDISQAHVVFEATVYSLADGSEVAHSKWRADFSYKYTDFAVDQSLDTDSKVAKFFGLTGDVLRVSGEKRKIIPMTFIVSDYKVKELLE